MQSVEEILGQVKFPIAVATANSRSISFFHKLLAWGGGGALALPADSAASQKIDSLKSNYTMESERRAHTSALQPALVAVRPTDSEPSIELFGELEPQSPAAASSPCDDLSVTKTAPTAHPSSPEEPASSTELGGNVEFF